MTEASGVSPQEIYDIYEEPLLHATAGVEIAHEAVRRAAGSTAINEAEEDLASAERYQRSLQAAGKASLHTIVDGRFEETLRVQMLFEGKDDEGAEKAFEHIVALERYADSDNPVVAVIGRLSPIVGLNSQQTLHLTRLNPATGEAAIWFNRERDEHFLEVDTSETYMINLTRNPTVRLQKTTASVERSVDTPLTRISFADDSESVEKLLADAGGGPLPPAIVYGEEAIGSLGAALAQKGEHLKLALYGSMQNMGLAYEGPAMVEGDEKRRLQEAFYTNLRTYAPIATLSVASGLSPGSDHYPLLTPGVQKFIGISDNDLAKEVESILQEKAVVRFPGRAVEVDTIDTFFSGSAGWKEVWSTLKRQGFTEAAERMLQPQNIVYHGAVIEREVLEARLNDGNPEKKLNARQRRRVQRTIEEIDDRLEDLAP